MADGIGSHHSAKSVKTDWLTPPFLIDRLGPFDLDPCAAVGQPWRTAKLQWNKQHDGLVQPWIGRVWLNPPYSAAGLNAWLPKMASHGRGTALIFARTETEPFFKYVWERASAVLFIEGRLHFHHASGERAAANSGGPSVLCAYGAEDAFRLESSEISGEFLPLRSGLRKRSKSFDENRRGKTHHG